MSGEVFDEFTKRSIEMHRLTKDEAVQNLWLRLKEIQHHGFVPFQIEGRLEWKPEGETASSDSAELLTDYYEAVGKITGARPVKEFQQRQGIYVINGKLLRQIYGTKAEDALPEIEIALADISLIVSTLAFVFRTAVCWTLANYVNVEKVLPPTLPDHGKPGWWFFPVNPYSRMHQGSIVTTKHVQEALGFHELVLQQKTPTGRQLRMALEWFRSGMSQNGFFMRYLNLFQSFETIVNGLYDILPSNFQPPKYRGEKKKRIMAALERLTETNCIKLVDNAHKIINPSFLIKASCVGKYLFSTDGETLKKYEDQLPRLYDIRNDVAHANLYEGHSKDLQQVSEACYDMKVFAHTVLWQVITRLTDIELLHNHKS